MSPSAWIAIAALSLALFAQLAGVLIWGAKTSEKVRNLESKAKEQGDLRDLVIEMRTEMRGVQEGMRGFQKAIENLAEALNRPVARRRAEG